MTCKNCIHFEICDYQTDVDDDFKDYEDIRYMDERKREALLEWLDRRYGTKGV